MGVGPGTTCTGERHPEDVGTGGSSSVQKQPSALRATKEADQISPSKINVEFSALGNLNLHVGFPWEL